MAGIAELNDRDGDSTAVTCGVNEEQRIAREEEELEKLALEALLTKAKQDKIRADREGVSGWIGPSMPTTNKRFANNLVASAVISNTKLDLPRSESDQEIHDREMEGYRKRSRRHDYETDRDRKKDRRGHDREMERDYRREGKREIDRDHRRDRRSGYELEGDRKREKRRDYDTERRDRRSDHKMERERDAKRR